MDKRLNKQFERATRNLLNTVDSMGLDRLSRLQAKNFILLFRDSFKLEPVKRAVFKYDIGNEYNDFPYDSYGFCRASSFSFLALMNNPQWQLMYINGAWQYGPHYYIMHTPSKTVLDLTYDQYEYDGHDIPYHLGRPVKIDANGRNVVIRFLHAIGVDHMRVIQNLDSGRF